MASMFSVTFTKCTIYPFFTLINPSSEALRVDLLAALLHVQVLTAKQAPCVVRSIHLWGPMHAYNISCIVLVVHYFAYRIESCVKVASLAMNLSHRTSDLL